MRELLTDETPLKICDLWALVAYVLPEQRMEKCTEKATKTLEKVKKSLSDFLCTSSQPYGEKCRVNVSL